MIFLNIIFIYIFHFNYLYNIFIKPRYVLQIPRKDKIALLKNWGWGAFPRQMWKYTNDTEVYLMQLLINSLILRNLIIFFWVLNCEDKEVLNSESKFINSHIISYIGIRCYTVPTVYFLCSIICWGAVVVVILWKLDLQLPMQSVSITTNIVSSNLAQSKCTP